MTEAKAITMDRRFIGRFHNIPRDTVVQVIRFFPRRRAVVSHNGRLVLTFTTLLRRIK